MRGFSLLEMGIVILLIGLLAGGLVTGQKLQEAANILTEFQNFTTAISQFKEKYEELPGDMTRATEFWGIAGGATGSDIACWTTDSSSLSNPELTCNGNGDGYIALPIPTAAGGETNIWYYNERFRVWQQLASSGLLSGKYTVRQYGTTCSGVKPGSNVPKSEYVDSYYNFSSALYGVPAAHPDHFPSPQGYNAIRYYTHGQKFTPAFLYLLDSNADDGLPGMGKYESYKSTSSWQPGCTTTDSAETSRYNLASTDRICQGLHLKF